MTEQLKTTVDESVKALVNEQSDTQAEWVRKAIHEKIARDTEKKRHVYANDPIKPEMTQFEALYLANILWQHAEETEDEHKQIHCEWWARSLHSMRNTREDGF